MEFSFGDHVLNLDRRELRRGAELVALEPQVFDLLVYLVQNRDRVVSKDDLLMAVWGGRIVSESTFTSRISAVRTAPLQCSGPPLPRRRSEGLCEARCGSTAERHRCRRPFRVGRRSRNKLWMQR